MFLLFVFIFIDTAHERCIEERRVAIAESDTAQTSSNAIESSLAVNYFVELVFCGITNNKMCEASMRASAHADERIEFCMRKISVDGSWLVLITVTLLSSIFSSTGGRAHATAKCSVWCDFFFLSHSQSLNANCDTTCEMKTKRIAR